MSKYSKNNSRKIFKKCAVHTCCNNTIEKPSLKFLAFPKNDKIARIWAVNAGREDILNDPQNTITKHYLCAEHFQDKVLKSDHDKQDFKNHLDPIPTIFSDNLNKYIQKESNYDLEINSLTEINVFCDNLFNFDFGRINYTDSFYDNIFEQPPDVLDQFMKQEFCRLCAKSLPTKYLVSLYNENYADMLELCLPGKFYKNDELSHKICYNCVSKLQSCYNILKSFIDANNNLRTLFEKCRKVEKICTINSEQDEPKTELQINEDKLNDQIPDAEPLENCSKFINDNKFDISQNPNKNEEKTDDVPIFSPLEKNDYYDNLIEINPLAKPYKNVDEIEQIKFQCVMCPKLFSTKKEVIRHVSTEHPNSEHKIVYKVVKAKKIFNILKLPEFYSCSARYECLLCSSHHMSKNTIIKHTQRHHPTISKGKFLCRLIKAKKYQKNIFTCLRCKETFTSLRKYRIHIQRHIEFKCEKCDLSFNRIHKLKNHSKIHDIPKVYSCIGCDQKFDTKNDLNEHEEIHKQPREDVSCAKCGKEFTSAFSLRKHKQIHESSLCYICGKLFPTITYLNSHLITHSNERPFSCTSCVKSFKSINALKMHSISHQPDKNYVCQVCGKRFRTSGVLRQHMKVHSTEKPYVCDICGKAFNRSGNLRKHREIHKFISETESSHVTGDKKLFPCSICHKTFRLKLQMQIHFRLHSGERPYKCQFCDKSFRSKPSLNQHTLIHLEVYPHACDFCDRKFRRQQSLIVHRKTHTGERPFPCPICGRAFANRGDMIKHKRIHLRKTDKFNQVLS